MPNNHTEKALEYLKQYYYEELHSEGQEAVDRLYDELKQRIVDVALTSQQAEHDKETERIKTEYNDKLEAYMKRKQEDKVMVESRHREEISSLQKENKDYKKYVKELNKTSYLAEEHLFEEIKELKSRLCKAESISANAETQLANRDKEILEWADVNSFCSDDFLNVNLIDVKDLKQFLNSKSRLQFGELDNVTGQTVKDTNHVSPISKSSKDIGRGKNE